MRHSSSSFIILFVLAWAFALTTEAFHLRSGVPRKKIQDVRALMGDDDDDDDGCGGKGGKGGKGDKSKDGDDDDDTRDCDKQADEPAAPTSSPTSLQRVISGTVMVDSDNDDIGDSASSGVTVQLLNLSGNSLVATTITDANGDFAFRVKPGTYVLREPNNPPNAPLDVSEPPSPVFANFRDNTGNVFVDEPEREISGTVYVDHDGDGIGDAVSPNVEIRLLDASGNVLDTTTTLSDGSYSFRVEPGSYSVDQPVNAVGYDLDVTPNDKSVNVNSGDSPGNDFIDEAATADPTPTPTPRPTPAPTTRPTPGPTPNPTPRPTPNPTPQPTPGPTPNPTPRPTPGPTPDPSPGPTAQPSRFPTPGPTPDPSPGPTAPPTPEPTPGPTAPPTPQPTSGPTANPTPAVREIAGTVREDINNDNAGELPMGGSTVKLIDSSGTTISSTLVGSSGEYLFQVNPGVYTVEEVNPPNFLDVSDAMLSVDVTDSSSSDNDFINEPVRIISGAVFVDDDTDGTGDLRSPNVEIQLLDASENILYTTMTLSDGRYSFQVAPGSYSVKQPFNVPGYDVDVTPNDIPVEVTSGDSPGNDFIDAAIREITGTVWEDTNDDDAGDQPMGGSTVKLIDSSGATIQSTVVGSTGEYVFEVNPGVYTVEEANPPDYVDVSDATLSVDVTTSSSSNNDFINEPYRVISGFVLVDNNGDGSGDDPTADHLIELKQDGLIIDSTTTSSTGFYSFKVMPGKYVVEEPMNPPDAPRSVTPDSLEADVTAGDSENNNFINEPGPPCINTKPDKFNEVDEGCTQEKPLCVDEFGNSIPMGEDGVQCITCDPINDIDVCIVLDESGSISVDEWKQQTAFITGLIDIIDSNFMTSDFDVSTFSTTAQLHDSNLDATAAKDLIESYSKKGGFTATGAGIRTCITATSGPLDDQPDDNMFLILLTDGKPNRPRNNGPADALAAADMAKSRDVTLVPIGVGNGEITTQLDVLASPGFTGFQAQDFDNLALNGTLPQLILDSIDRKCA